MKRLTQQTNENANIVETTLIQKAENSYFGDAIDKLAKFENFYDDLENQLTIIATEMDKLRDEDKSHSPRFKELFVKKRLRQ